MKIQLLSVCLALAATVQPLAVNAEAMRDDVYVMVEHAAHRFIAAAAGHVDKDKFKAEPRILHKDPRYGYKQLCLGKGARYPDLAVGTRVLNEEEYLRCSTNDLGKLVKMKLGYEALVLATSEKTPAMDLGARDVFHLLARDIPKPGSKMKERLTANPFQLYKDANDKLPAATIKIFGPPKDSADDRAVKELAMEGGCRTWPWIVDMKYIQRSARLYRAICWDQRRDGNYEYATADSPSVSERLRKTPGAIGFMSFNDWQKDNQGLRALTIEQLPPSAKTIQAELYPLSRPIFMYFKVNSLQEVPGFADVMNELMNEKVIGKGGYLESIGLVPMAEKEMKKQLEQALEFKPFSTN